MREFSGVLVATLLVSFGSSFLAAQDNADLGGPPKVLVIQREFLKPGKSGSTHEKSEGAFVRAMAASKSGSHYLAMDSLTGTKRSLFFSRYDSFAAWEEDNKNIEKDATLTAALDRAALADGELLSDYDTGVFLYQAELSMPAPVNIGQMRYMEILSFNVKEGHRKEWNELVGTYKAAYQKGEPNAQWAMYEKEYGGEMGVFLMIRPMKSAAEVDHLMTAGETVRSAMSEADRAKVAELAAVCIGSSASNLYKFNPKISYATDQMIQADPAFWKQRAAATRPEAKPRQQEGSPVQ